MRKQPVVADNRPGAGGLIAMQTLANANPDGYPIGTASSSMMVVPLRYAKPRPGQLKFAFVGSGTAAHLSAEIFAKAAGISEVHVPFKNIADASTEMFAGPVHFIGCVAPAATPVMRENRVRALAVTSKTRALGFPDLSMVAEAGLPRAAVENAVRHCRTCTCTCAVCHHSQTARRYCYHTEAP